MLKNLKVFSGEKGNLFAMNSLTDFHPKRFFYVTGVPKGESRGFHAHKRDRQLIVCIKGKVAVTLDSGASPSEFLLQEGQAILMETMVWGIQKYLTGDDIILVLCSEEHDDDEYIKSYDQFLELLKEN